MDQPDSVEPASKGGRPSRASQDTTGRFNCSKCGAEGRVRKTTWSLWHMQCPNCESGKWQVFIPPEQREEMQRKRRH